MALKVCRISVLLLFTYKVNSVDGFQGREKEFILFSAVRTKSVGFLCDEKRLNVMLTRARCGLLVVGNMKLLSQDSMWKKWLEWVAQNKYIVTVDDFNNEKLPNKTDNPKSSHQNNKRNSNNNNYVPKHKNNKKL